MTEHHKPTPLQIGNRLIGPNEPCYIIAEAGINHNGDVELAKKLIDAALFAGADAVKFQKRKLNEVYQQSILDQPRDGEQGLQYILPLLVEFELSDDDFRRVADYAAVRGITFLCTAWDWASVDFLETLGVPGYKIGSPDMTNFPLIEHVVATGKPLFVSTGMSTEDEIRRTLSFLKEKNAKCGLFHCVSTYPASPEEVNLRFMHTLHEWSGWPVGYSGHDTGTSIALAAVAMGACMLEKHLTLDRKMRGPDHTSSLEPAVFAEQVKAVREVQAAMGVAHRWITRGEVLNRRTLSKSLVAAREIAPGTVVTRDMIASKGPGMGLSPQLIGDLVGKRIERPLKKDDFFLDADLGKSEQRQRLKSVDLGLRWGMIARFNDIDILLPRFEDSGMSLVEFHVSDRDLDAGIGAFKKVTYPFELVVHAPEYQHEKLIDLCSADEDVRMSSVKRIQKVIDLVRQLAPSFKPSPRGPKIVFHCGGMWPTPAPYDQAAASERLLDAIRHLDRSGVDLLLENLPPFPWYFGGRWFGHVLTDCANTVALCEASGMGLCFDTSHAALQCNRDGFDLQEFARQVTPFVRHLHISDGAGTGGEGLQIGEGDVNFVELMPILSKSQATMVPEIWMGHHQEGKGFQVALERLTQIVWAGRALRRADPGSVRPELESLIVPSTATIFTALQTIDLNRMGIAFICDDAHKILGVVTDGDLRHAFVKGNNLHTPITDVMTKNFASGTPEMTAADRRAKLPGRTQVLPIVDSAGRLVDFASGLTA